MAILEKWQGSFYKAFEKLSKKYNIDQNKAYDLFYKTVDLGEGDNRDTGDLTPAMVNEIVEDFLLDLSVKAHTGGQYGGIPAESLLNIPWDEDNLSWYGQGVAFVDGAKNRVEIVEQFWRHPIMIPIYLISAVAAFFAVKILVERSANTTFKGTGFSQAGQTGFKNAKFLVRKSYDGLKSAFKK